MLASCLVFSLVDKSAPKVRSNSDSLSVTLSALIFELNFSIEIETLFSNAWATASFKVSDRMALDADVSSVAAWTVVMLARGKQTKKLIARIKGNMASRNLELIKEYVYYS